MTTHAAWVRRDFDILPVAKGAVAGRGPAGVAASRARFSEWFVVGMTLVLTGVLAAAVRHAVLWAPGAPAAGGIMFPWPSL